MRVATAAGGTAVRPTGATRPDTITSATGLLASAVVVVIGFDVDMPPFPVAAV